MPRLEPPASEPTSPDPGSSKGVLGLSPRRRRLRRTIGILACLAFIGAGLGIALHYGGRPTVYHPDEKLADITSELARTLPPGAPRPHFEDLTTNARLAGFRTFRGTRTSQLPEDMGCGVAWGDFNNDGWEDVFLVSAGGPMSARDEDLAPCELYENLGNGSFRKVQGSPEIRIHGMGAAWGDYDEDGWLDLVVTGYGRTLLFHNEGGTGKFLADTRFPDLPGFWSSASWGDYDNDRHLDLYLCAYVDYRATEADRARLSAQISTAVPYTLNPASFSPATNVLLHNNGNGTFSDVSELLKVTNPTGRSLGALWHDFDDDGWLDLYVANDISDNVLFHNSHGQFEDVSHAAYVADYRSAMGLAAGDYDRDGDDDLFIGHWLGQENALYENLFVDNRKTASPAVAGATNSNPAAKRPPLCFMDSADRLGLGQIALPYVSWGTDFCDFDGDGWLDLVVANGSTLEEDGPFPRKLKPQESFLFWNDHGRYFHNLAPLDRALATPHVGRGLALCDYDNDGAMDVLISYLGEGVQLLRNQMQTGHWLKIQFRSRLANGTPRGFGDGAKVIAHVNGVALRRTVSSVSYLSQSSRVVHFGLGEADHIDRLEVRWLGGATNTFEGLSANTFYEVTEGEASPRQVVPQRRTASANGALIPAVGASVPSGADKNKEVEFWRRARAAMDALKVTKDIPRAIEMFRGALELNPKHEDSRYYLGQCLAGQGDFAGAVAEFEELTRINPHSHRGFRQWGVVKACYAESDSDLAEAERLLEGAQALNPEETGVLLVLGEISVLRGDYKKAEQRLAAVCQTNAKAVGGFFLRGFLAVQAGREDLAVTFLEAARAALGKDWQPKGSTGEGDVKQKQHVEQTPLTHFWEEWDGEPDPRMAFKSLAEYLKRETRKP